MLANKSDSFLKSSLSQLLLQNFDQGEDPKYATVPQCHVDEVRPSILERYQYKKMMIELNGTDQDGQTVSNHATVSTNSRSKCSSKPITVRAMNRSIESFCRYCLSKIHLEIDHKKEREKITKYNKKNKKTHDKSTNMNTNGNGNENPSNFASGLTSSQAAKLKQKTQRSKNSNYDSHSRHLRPAFEILPPLFESCTHTLLYQNSYLLDGVKYDYEPNKKNQDQCVSTKLRLNYLKFLKSVNKNLKPSDRDIVFGNAKVIFNPEPRWEGSRIDWLIKLEQQYEMGLSKSKNVKAHEYIKSAEEQITESGKTISYFRPHLKHSKDNKNKDKQNEKPKQRENRKQRNDDRN